MAYYSKFGGADIEKWVGEVPSLKSRLDACETDVSQAIYDSSERNDPVPITFTIEVEGWKEIEINY